jgi:hypothetical protein
VRHPLSCGTRSQLESSLKQLASAYQQSFAKVDC